MREVFVHQDSARVGLYKSILDSNGIPNFVRNGLSNNSVTDLPSGAFFPALCVVDDDDYERAVEVLRNVHKPEPTNASDWKCAGCGEEVPGSFEHCWQCGASSTGGEPVSAITQPPGKTATSVAAGSNLRIASVFRWLVVVNALLGLLGFWLYPYLEYSPPPELKQWLKEQDNIPDWLGRLVYFVWLARNACWVFAQLLCFLLWNPGRMFMLAVVVSDILIAAVFPQGFVPRWVNALYYIQVLLSGVLLALMYLSPLRERFSSKSQGR